MSRATKGSSIAAYNATKLVYHAAKIKGGDIKICTAAHPEKNRQQYLTLYQRMIAEKLSRKQSNNDAQIAIVAQQEQTAAAYAQVATKRRVASMDDSVIDVDGGDQHLTVASSSKKRARNMRQSQLITSIPSASANNIEKMDTAIADFLLSNALPPSLSECPKLKLLLQTAKHAPLGYNPPTRQTVAGSLLDANYKTVVDKISSQLYCQTSLNQYIGFGYKQSCRIIRCC